MKIVFLEAQSIGDDIDLSGFDALGEVVKYPIATAEQTPELIADADVAVLSKIPVNEATIQIVWVASFDSGESAVLHKISIYKLYDLLPYKLYGVNRQKPRNLQHFRGMGYFL